MKICPMNSGRKRRYLTSYDSGNPGAEGYQFHVYESEGGKKTGDYYVDKDTGKVYRYTKDNKIMEY